MAQPTRFAALSPSGARAVFGLLAALLVATLTALGVPDAPAAADTSGLADVVLYGTIIDNVRHGGDYYAVAADALRAGNFPLRPFVTFRLPTLAVVQATLPPVAVAALLYALAAAVMLAWHARLRAAIPRPVPLTVALILLAAGLAAFIQPTIALFHEVWAGLLIALSLALRHRGRWIESVALGLAATLIRETAALYLLVMTLFALAERERREALAWVAAAGVLAAVVLLHAHAVARVVRPLDPASPGWAGLLGFGFFVKTMTLSTALTLAPAWVAALLVGLSLFGWAAWRDSLAARTLATILAYAALLALFGRADTFYWGLLVAPTLLVGLAFVPDAVRDLLDAALDTRRITVTRVPR